MKKKYDLRVSKRPILKKLIMEIKISILIIALSLGNILASNTYSQVTKVTLNAEKKSLEQVMDEIEQQSEFYFVFNQKQIDIDRKINIRVEDKVINEILPYLFKGTNVNYTILDRKILLTTDDKSEFLEKGYSEELFQQRIISGKIRDRNGNLLTGVNVIVTGTTTGTISDIDGSYSLNIPPGSKSLTFSFIGMKSVEIPIGQSNSLDIILEEDAVGLEEVVVIGYGTVKKSNLTGSISSIRGKELAQATTGGIQDVLQGRLAGVLITPTSGQPGGATDLSVRGVATFGDGNPLYVIDGIPLITDQVSRNVNPIASLNPDNIESIQVLKDASAAAIYGARAANGVVIITTNRGKSGENQLQFKMSTGFADVTRFYPMMTTEQWIPYSIDAYKNANKQIPIAFTEPFLSENLKRNTDWQKEGFKTGILQNYWLGISGGSNFSNHFISLGYVDEGGTLPQSNFSRFSAKINTDFNILKRLKIGESIELSRSRWDGTFTQSSYTIRQLLQQGPTVPVYDDDTDGFDGPQLKYGPVGRQNTIGHLTLEENYQIENRLLGNVFAEYEPIPGLVNRFSLGTDIAQSRTFRFIPTYVMGDRKNTLASLSETRGDLNTSLLENTLTYHKTINEIHNITVLAGYSQQKSWRTNTSVTVRTFPSDDIRTIEASFEERSINGLETGFSLRSLIARLNYTYNNKYNFMGVIRRDGSSRFGSNNRYGVFPSLSGSWLISKEAFMSGIDQVSNLILRTSWGKVGNQDINNFAQYATISSGVNYIFGSTQTLIPGSTYLNMGNADLKWEITTQTDFGVDLGLFKDKLAFTIDYYIKNTDDILLQLPIPTTSGFRRTNGPFVNAGSMGNRGFEFTVNHRNILTNGFTYSISGNIATNKNKITSLNRGEPIYATQASGKQVAQTITQEGYPLGSFFGYVMEGVFKDAEDLANHAFQDGSEVGDVKFKDLNSDGVINALDQQIIGSPFPKFTYGLNSDIEFKNFDFAVFVYGKQGHDIYHLLWADLNEGEGDNNATTEMLQRWTPTNTATNVPRAITGQPGGNTRPSSRFIENASFLRIQSISLGYNLGKLIPKNFNVSRLRIYVSGTNLYTITKYKGYNPEVGKLITGARSSLTQGIDVGMYPIPRRVEGGIQIDF